MSVRREYTPEKIRHLRDNEIFVFGSNLAGHHYGGAAHTAHTKFGAKWGVGEGITGDCYAFPTLDVAFKKLTDKQLQKAKERLCGYAEKHPEKKFLLTRLGCGIAGYPEEKMQMLFATVPFNIVKPKNW